MSAGPLSAAVAHLGHAVRPPDPRPDAALVAAFVRDRCEAAAAELVRRHGPAVYGACRRIHAADAADAFQAVWLVFSRKAGGIRPPGMVGAWLHGVAVKVATKARTQSLTRRRRLMAAAKPDHATDPPPPDPALAAVLDEEIARLPEKLRRAVLLCDLGGKTRREAALELGWPEGTVATRLAKGRERLAVRLRRRGVTLPAAGLAAALAPEATAVPVPLAAAVAAVRLMTGTAAVPPAALLLADSVGTPMNPATWKLAALGLLAAVGLTAGGVGFAPPADPPPDKPAAAVAGPAESGEWTLKAVLKDHGQMVYDAAFAPDGSWFATAGADGTVIVWDAATLAVKRRIEVVKNLPLPAPELPPANGGEPLPPPELPGRAGRKPGSNPPWVGVWAGPAGELRVSFYDPAGKRRVGRFDPGTGRNLGEADHGFAPWLGRTLWTGPDGRWVIAGGDGPDVPLDLSATGAAPGERVTHGDVSPNGRVVAAAKWDPAAGTRVWFGDAAGKRVSERRLAHPAHGVLYRTAFTPDGRRYAAATDARTLAVFAAPDWGEAYRLDDPAVTHQDAVAFTPDGRQLLHSGLREEYKAGWWGLARGTVAHRELWVRDAATGAVRQTLALRPPTPLTAANAASVAGTGPDVSRLAVSPDGRTLVLAMGLFDRARPVESAGEQAAKAAAGEVRVYVRGAVKPPAPPKAEDKPKSDDGPERNQDLWVWQQRPAADDKSSTKDKPVCSVAFSPDGKQIATGHDSQQLTVRQADTLRWLKTFSFPRPERDAPRADVSFSPDGDWLAAVQSGGVSFHPTAARKVPREPRPRLPMIQVDRRIGQPGLSAVAFAPDGRRVAFTDGRTLWVQTPGSPGGVQFGPLAGSTEGPAAVSWAPDGRRLVFLPNVRVEGKFIAQVWGAGSGEPMALLAHGPARLTGAVWAADGKRIVTADEAGEIVVWDGVTFKERKRVKAAGSVTALAMRADGRRFAAGVTGPATQVKVWTLQEGSDPDNWLGSSTLPQPAAVRGLAFSPDGKVLAAGTDAGLAVWDRVKVAPKDGNR